MCARRQRLSTIGAPPCSSPLREAQQDDALSSHGSQQRQGYLVLHGRTLNACDFSVQWDKREFRYGQLWPRCLVVMSCRKTNVNPANTNMPAQDVFNVSCRHAAYLSTVMFLSLLPRKADAFTRQPDRENGEEPRHRCPLPLHTWQRGFSSLT